MPEPKEPETPTGFTYLRSGADREQVELLTKGWKSGVPSEPEAEAEPEEDTADDGYPEDGTIPAVKRWIGDDVDRAQVAYEAEQERETPRTTLMEFLEDMLSEPDEE